MGMYHRENAQEAFLVLAGTCVLIVEGEERPLGPWDFFHCPPRTKHVIVGAGIEPALVLGVGARKGQASYPVDEAAVRHGGGVEQKTDSPSEAYARFSKPEEGLRRSSPNPRTQRKSLFASMSNHIANSVICRPAMKSTATKTIVGVVISFPARRRTTSIAPSRKPTSVISTPNA